jgi:hypothetical protein
VARRHMDDAQRGRAGVGAERDPCLAAREPDGAIGAPMDERAERRSEVQSAAQLELSVPFLQRQRAQRRTESRIGLGPAWVASNSARVRMPR